MKTIKKLTYNFLSIRWTRSVHFLLLRQKQKPNIIPYCQYKGFDNKKVREN